MSYPCVNSIFSPRGFFMSSAFARQFHLFGQSQEKQMQGSRSYSLNDFGRQESTYVVCFVCIMQECRPKALSSHGASNAFRTHGPPKAFGTSGPPKDFGTHGPPEAFGFHCFPQACRFKNPNSFSFVQDYTDVIYMCICCFSKLDFCVYPVSRKTKACNSIMDDFKNGFPVFQFE